jgi:hypothetical protein
MKIYYTVLTRMGYSHEVLIDDPEEAERLRIACDEIYPVCNPHTVIALVPKAEAEAAIEVPDEIAAVVRAVEQMNWNGGVERFGCDCPVCEVVRVFRGLTPAQRKACGLEEKDRQ